MMSENSRLGVSPQTITLSSLMLTRPQKSPTLFDSFEKNSSLESDGTTRVGTRQLGRIGQGNN